MQFAAHMKPFYGAGPRRKRADHKEGMGGGEGPCEKVSPYNKGRDASVKKKKEPGGQGH